jgi:hypothetical protein
MTSHLYKCHVTSFVNLIRTKMMNGNGCYLCKCNYQNFHVVFTCCIACIMLYWTVAISNDVSYL